MSDLPTLASLGLVVGVVAAMTWICSETLRRMHARGTRGRYVWASAARATKWPALGYLLLSACVEVTYGSRAMAALPMTGVGLWLWVHHESRDDDDDNLWDDLADWVRGGALAIGAD